LTQQSIPRQPASLSATPFSKGELTAFGIEGCLFFNLSCLNDQVKDFLPEV
jgi:hypothetical protein